MNKADAKYCGRDFETGRAIQRLRGRVALGTARAEKLTQLILAKVFRGELVVTEAELARREGRSYDSAVELLARIQKPPARFRPFRFRLEGKRKFRND